MHTQKRYHYGFPGIGSLYFSREASLDLSFLKILSTNSLVSIRIQTLDRKTDSNLRKMKKKSIMKDFCGLKYCQYNRLRSDNKIGQKMDLNPFFSQKYDGL